MEAGYRESLFPNRLPGHDPGAVDCVALLPGSGPLWPCGLGTLVLRRTSWSRRSHVGSDAAERWRAGAAESDPSGRGDSCCTERTQLGSRKASVS